MKKRFIAIRNQANDQILELYFLDVIQDTFDFWTGMSYSKVQEIIDKVNYYKPTKIKVIIDSIGGDAQTAISIYNFLKNINAKIEVEIIGMCCSSAAVLSMCANKGKLRIAKNAFMMIHEAEGGSWGSAEEIRQFADLVDKYNQQIADILAARSGKTSEEIMSLWANGDYWMSGDEAVAQGFADQTFNDVEANQSIAARLKDSPQYKNIPASIMNAAKTDEGEEDDEQPKSFKNYLEDMKKFITNLVKGIMETKVTDATKPQEILNVIGKQLETSMGEFADEAQSEITNQVKTQVDAIKLTITNELTASITTELKKVYDQDITDLKKANEDLEKEIVDLKGGEGASGKEKKDPTAIGNWA